MSEQSRNEANARAASELDGTEDLEDLFENAPCGYLSLDQTSRIVKANTTFARWTGWSKDELEKRTFPTLLNIAGRIYYETHFAPLLRMQGFFNEVALEVLRKDGSSLSVLVNAVERRDESGAVRFIRVTIFDATDRRRYERELLAARAAADAVAAELRELNATLQKRVDEAVAERLKAEQSQRHGQKLEAIGQLTGGVAHDFNNLLTVIIGGLESIERHTKHLEDSESLARVRRARSMAEQGAHRAATLTARLLAFSRQQALAPAVVDAGRLVIDISDMLQRSLGETVALEVVTGAGLWKAFVDPTELENVLINLAVNARDAMPAGGKLTIETGNAYLDETYVAGITEPVVPGQYVLIAVSDTGCGMDAATIEKVFEPYFTTKPVGSGTGLGLSHVYGFIRQSGGHVRIYSEVGEGTSVKLYLPRAQGVAQENVNARPLAPYTAGGSETILVVEDDDDLRAFAVESLRELGYHVLAARSGPRALELIDANMNIVLLFTDVVLPDGMSGRALASVALLRRPELKVLYTTGYTRNAIAHHGRLDPEVHMLPKPYTFAVLGNKIRDLLDRD